MEKQVHGENILYEQLWTYTGRNLQIYHDIERI